MTPQKLLALDLESLEKLSDEDILEIWKPYLAIVQPKEKARKEVKEKVNLSKVKNTQARYEDSLKTARELMERFGIKDIKI